MGLALGLGACAPSPIGSSEQELVVPGDWDPPDSTRAIAATQYVDVVDPPTVLPLGSCTSTNPWVGTCTHPACTRAHPGTADLDVYIRTRWSYVGAGGTYTCRRNSNPRSTEYLSVHSVGRAIDLMIPMIGGDADNTRGDAVANWLIENAEYIGVQRVIWDGWYWNGERGFSQISDDRNSGGAYITDHHVNHIHMELSVAGADRLTEFFTHGAPPTTCPIVCYGTAVVAEDCSYVDCALTGEVCLDGPPRCGTGAPPEPMEAALDESAALPSVTAAAPLGRFNFVEPQRLFDTRTEADSTRLERSDGATSGPLGATRSGTLRDFPGLLEGTSSVWLNVAAVPLELPGFVSVLTAGTASTTSTLNFWPPRNRANATAVALGESAALTFLSNTDVHLVADWTGAFATTGLGFQTVGPLRVLDTRSTAMPITAGEPFTLDVGAPEGVVGIVASVTVIGGTDAGFLTAYPCNAAIPSTSHLNYMAGSVSTNTVIAELGDGDVCFYSNETVDLIVDLTGYLVPEGELSYQALTPTRLLDTRSAGTRYTGRLGVHQVIELPIQTLPGMPGQVYSVVANLTSISPGSRGFLTAFRCGAAVPATSSLNFDSDDPAAALVVSSTGGGSLCIFASARTDVVIDLLGVFVPTPGAATPTPGPGPMTPDVPENPARSSDGSVDGDAGVGPRPAPSGGCSVSVGASAGSGMSSIVLLGLCLAALRMRRRAITRRDRSRS